MADEEEQDCCPLCMEELDITDKTFDACPCGYQVSARFLCAGHPPPRPLPFPATTPPRASRTHAWIWGPFGHIGLSLVLASDQE